MATKKKVVKKKHDPRGARYDVRSNADLAYKAFMKMPEKEWLGLVASLAGGGVLEPEESKGFARASKERAAKNNLIAAAPKRVTEDHEQLKAVLRASVPYEQPLLMGADLAPAQLNLYVNEAISRAEKSVEVAVLNLGNALTQKQLSTWETTRIREAAKKLAGICEKLETHAKNLAVEAIERLGFLVEGTHAKQMEQNGYVLRIRPYALTTDPKKYEPMMQAKGIPPERYADATVTYKPNEKKLQQAVAEGVFTQQEYEAMRKDLTWVLERPRSLEELKALPRDFDGSEVQP